MAPPLASSGTDVLKKFKYNNRAGVAELVDAQDLKSCESNLVRVRSPPSAPFVKQHTKIYCMFYTYILLLKNNQLYTGYTESLSRRLTEHRQGKVKTTSKYLPVKLIFHEAYINKSDAKRREKYLKTTKGRSTIKLMLKNTLQDLPRTT